jgi:hypothetical protein
MSRDGLSDQLLVPLRTHGGIDAVGRIVLDGERLLLLGPNDSLLEAPIRGGAAKLLIPKVTALAVEPSGIYFSPCRGHSISVLDRTVGAPRVLVGGEELPLDIIVDDLYVYWIGDAGASLKRAPRHGGVSSTIAKGPIRRLVGSRDAIYWVRTGSPDHSVMRYRKSDEEVAVLAHSHGGGNLAIDDSFVYFADHRTATISRVPR